MMSDYPGAREYDIQSSYFEYGPSASDAVIIDYRQQLLAWDCRPFIITIGWGTSYDEALQEALDSKANNDSASAPYDELEHVTW